MESPASYSLTSVATTPANDRPVPKKTKSRRTSVSKQSCTHVSMVKYYSNDHSCQICHRFPTTGFVYVCEQDKLGLLRLPYLAKARKKLLKPTRKDRLDHVSFDFHPKVQVGIDNGHYTSGQIEVLKAQKAHVRAVIEKSLEGDSASRTNNVAVTLDNANIPLSTHDEQDSRVIGWLKRVSNKRENDRATQMCNFKCCHSCRPISRDRTFTSFEAALFDEIEVPSRWHPETMPVQDYQTMLNIGLRLSWNDLGEQDHRVTSGYESVLLDMSNEPQISINDYSIEGYTRGIHDAIKHAIRTNTYPNLQIRTANLDETQLDALCLDLQNNGGQDIAVWEALRKVELEQAVRTPLPWSTKDDGDLLQIDLFQNEQAHTETVCIEKHVRLTEEAVESKLPDLVLAV